MTLSQQEKELAAEIDFDEEVLEIIKQEFQAEMQKIHLNQKVYLKDDELSCLNEVLPEYYLDFNQDIYGDYNYAGNILVEGLSVRMPELEDRKQIFFKLKHLLALKGYITVCADQIGLLSEDQLLNRVIFRAICYLFRVDLKIEVFKGQDPLDIIKINQTNGYKYDISPKNIINKLKCWQKLSEFEIIFASNSGFSLEFTKLPRDLEDFTRDVYEFCPDVQNPKKVIKEIKKSKSLYLSWD